MREFSAPATVTVATEENLTDMVWANAERFGDAVGFRRRVDGTWVDVTTAEFAAQVLAVSKGLIAAGLRQGDRVGLMSRTRYEWTLFDFAIWSAGCVTVPVYETSSADQIEWIMSDSEAAALIVESPEHRAEVNSIIGNVPSVEHVWQIDGPVEGGGSTAVAELTSAGAEIADERVHERRRAVGADDTATLIYTSGTTGRPKGCVLTHRNMLAEVRGDLDAFPQLMRPGNSMLMFLPMAHVLARAISISCVYARLTLGHTGDVKDLVNDLGSFRPTFVLAVPRVFEKVYNTAKQKAHSEGKGRIFDAAEATAVAYSRAKNEAGGPGLALRAKHFVFDKLVYGKLRAALGGRCVAAVSGGAPLGERLTHFYFGVGVPVLEGYGLTETTAAAAVNVEDDYRIGTVGKPIAGTTIRIADDGEVLVKGDVVFHRYWNNDAATADSLEDGWFHTGDLGSLDEDGFLRITGRKKEIIVTAGGKNVAPAVLEDHIRAHPLISQCMVVGDQKPFIGVLVTLDPEFLPSWLAERGRPTDTPASELAEDPDMRAEVQRAIDEANQAVSKAERIKQFRILPQDFSEDRGEMTPSLKVKRNKVAENYASEIAAIYS
ncbi:long-chain fatty acid--CoA ligase [Actinopolyspora erythraea]|uniref:Acyl-CoA synthetase n=1 Tax=Actinopolyspora erythraea TaxID=414996 RepID=A0A099D567_9ACTN|nr:long-chain fatty acid--CoA ligase [Actinopolyspora erythraea]ASU79556.1 long-chain fatty acid--CoA ligase [Actinopolyspora erythraea]KGI81056.1 long-chain fatty acid--CoA ligase [Actinopolyspora erythraea]